MKTIRTTLNLRKHEARRLMDRGYEIQHIETRTSTREMKAGFWTRPARADDISESEIPY